MKKKSTYFNLLKAFSIDTFIWFYIILCTYKIIYQKIILDLRYDEFSWDAPLYSLIAAILIVLPCIAIKKYSVGVHYFCEQTSSNNSPKENIEKSFFKTFHGFIISLMVVLTFIAGMKITQISMNEFFSIDGLNGAKRIFTALLTPNWAIFETALFAAIETIYMAFIATILAIPISFVLSFLAARNLAMQSRSLFSIYLICRFILNLTRSIEPLVWAIIFSVWVGIGPFAGMMALWLHSIASLTKLYSEQIEDIDEGPVEAITSTGAHPIQIIWFGIVPQIVIPFLSYTIYRWDINVRMATVIGLVGGGGIGTLLMQYQGLAKWNEVGLLVIFIAAIVWAMDYASAKIREAIK